MPESNELDELDAIHRSATSPPWEHKWEVVEEPDEHGYYPQREVWAGEDSMHLATFAYLQHLQLFLAALKLPKLTAEVRRLEDVVAAARAYLVLGPQDDCPSRFALEAALARLDGEVDR